MYHHWISREEGEPAPRNEHAISTSSPLRVVMSRGTSVKRAAGGERQSGLKASSEQRLCLRSASWLQVNKPA